MKKEKLIIICVLIIGIAIVWSQVAKQNSIERQAQMKIDQENKVLAIEQAEKDELKAAEAFNKTMLNLCLKDADGAYWRYMELNGTEKDDGTVWAANSVWDRAEKKKNNAVDLCYKKYK